MLEKPNVILVDQTVPRKEATASKERGHSKKLACPAPSFVHISLQRIQASGLYLLRYELLT